MEDLPRYKIGFFPEEFVALSLFCHSDQSKLGYQLLDFLRKFICISVYSLTPQAEIILPVMLLKYLGRLPLAV
jgi:hypothetical protein